MTINILIGIGGTGAKIVESALHLLAAGVLPQSEVHIGLVDQDNANGNVGRAGQLLELLCEIKRNFESPESNGTAQGNYLDWSTDSAAGTRLFATRLSPLLDHGPHWRPADDSMPDLSSILMRGNRSAEEQALFDMLFRAKGAPEAHQEQDMDLSKGYRGRAHVGSAALISAMKFDSPDFGDKLKALIDRSQTGNEVRIFLAGSLFGGTGAAGFPTIARLLDNLRHSASSTGQTQPGPNQSKSILIGGVLMLPYFEFAPPPEDTANVVRSTQLLPQARVAIDFYENLQRREKPFDRLYAAGWDSMVALGYHEPGGDDQRNPALLPELVAALAVVDFFSAPTEGMDAAKPLAAARSAGGAFKWDDLPMDEERRASFKHDMGSALRFAVWWLHWIEPALERDDRAVWPKELMPDRDRGDATSRARRNLVAYATSLLHWASSLQLFSKTAVGRFELWDSTQLSVQNADDPANPVKIHSVMNEDRAEQAFNSFLHANDPKKPPAQATEVFELLRNTSATGKSRGLGQLVATVHRVARPVHGGRTA